MQRFIQILFVNFLLIGCLVHPALGQSKTDQQTFHALLRQYEQSINRANLKMASALWSHTDEVSFIHPRATEYGWSGIQNVYKMFDQLFAKRELHGSKEKITVYGETAWLTFEWVFDATMKADNSPLQTKGRETQLWRKINNRWKLVHAHYSGMPVTGERQGF